MDGRSRYNVGGEEAENEDGILPNKLGIKTQEGLDDAETVLLKDAYSHFSEKIEQRKISFDLSLLFEMHRYFLETLYPWAGKLRSSNISKDGVLFAAAMFLESAVGNFGKILLDNIPTEDDSKKIAAQKIALIHNEFNAIHPFREGNGRTIRLFLDMLAVSIGYTPIDWDTEAYMPACQKGLLGDHSKMAHLIYRGLVEKK